MFLIVFILWLFTKLSYIIYKPRVIYYKFKKSKQIPPIDNRILLEKASVLTEKIINKQISCMEIINAYIERIKSVNPYLNAIINERFTDALNDARKIDELLTTSGIKLDELREKYPLLGVPITVKGSISVAGLPNTSGLVGRTSIEPQDAVSLTYLRKAGAIPLLTSNVPELCLNWETSNKIIGTTNNPYNTNRTSGGSSGGEAALIASGASIVGLGSDVVGSLRLPSHFCGIFAHKPTPGLVSTHGHFPGCTDKEKWTNMFTIGPLVRYASDLKLILNVICEPETKKLIDLNKPVDINKLNVYYLKKCNESLGTNWSVSVQRTFQSVVDDLDRICVHKCTELKLPLFKHTTLLSYIPGLHLDGVDNLPGIHGRGNGIFSELFRFLTCRSKYMFTSICYNIGRWLVCLLPKPFIQQIFNDLECLKLQLESVLNENSVLILPTFRSTALYHTVFKTNVFDAAMLGIFNCLGLPVTNCPVGMDENGLPIGIQIVSAKYCDRLGIALAEELEKVRGGWKPPCAVNGMPVV